MVKRGTYCGQVFCVCVRVCLCVSLWFVFRMGGVGQGFFFFLFFAHAQKSRATAKKFKVVKVKATFLCNKKCLHCVAPVQLQVPALSMSQPLLFCEDIWCLTESGVCLY